MNDLVEALQNVRSGRRALSGRVHPPAPDAARIHLWLARQWYGRALGRVLLNGREDEQFARCDRALGWINKFAVEVIAAAPERISEMYERQAIEESGPGELE